MDIKEELGKLTRYNCDVVQNVAIPVIHSEGDYLSFIEVEELLCKASDKIAKLQLEKELLEDKIWKLNEALVDTERL